MTAIAIPQGSVRDDPAAERGDRSVLVVGVDGSRPSWDAFSWAAGEARRSNGRIIAVFATPLVGPEASMAVTAPMDFGAAELARDQMTDELAAEVESRAGELGVEASFVREYADAAQALSRIARSARADLIVVGRSEKMLHHLAGAVGRRLVLRGDSPVVVVVP
jgi:nucleotide-binding universal stress UspA family protein